jgi:hypothetical protein
LDCWFLIQTHKLSIASQFPVIKEIGPNVEDDELTPFVAIVRADHGPWFPAGYTQGIESLADCSCSVLDALAFGWQAVHSSSAKWGHQEERIAKENGGV